ncbi:MAG TPA: HAD family phosphatase [Candidatus Competibacteraceae bacterium]|nr:HAD family phosphatase [Candidatus Competibacteraceae bacterium]MCP5133673.1 HAD family phosphatase [Gammaproteobacteria bacterium]HPF59741.1 HAD family phosphatase [Candidatus Competibacteraceae bacterium]
MAIDDPAPGLAVPAWIRGLIFDCDGTLVDTLPLHYAAWSETFAELGLSCPLEFLLRHNGKPTDRIVALYNTEFNQAIDIKQFTEDKERRTYARLDLAQPLEPVAALARRYYGHLPMAVVSGSNRANVERALRAAGLRELFPVALTADDGLPPKPAPDLFLEAARQIDVDPHYCQVFEDADSGLEAARQAGMRATDVRPVLGNQMAVINLRDANLSVPSPAKGEHIGSMP